MLNDQHLIINLLCACITTSSKGEHKNLIGCLDSLLQKKQEEEEGYDCLFNTGAVFPLEQPQQHLSIDEMMIGTYCRISFSKETN